MVHVQRKPIRGCSASILASRRKSEPCRSEFIPLVEIRMCGFKHLTRSDSYITNLESRIRHLETPGHIPAFTPSWPTPVNRREGRENVAPSHGEDQSSPPLCSQHHRSPQSHVDRSYTHAMHTPRHPPERPPSGRPDGVNAMMGAVEEERPTQGFFGSSSAASFMRQIKTAVDDRVSSPHRRTSESILGMTPPSSLLSTHKERPSSVTNYVLPPRKTADSLMDVYWIKVFPLYPLIDGAQMRTEYTKIWTGEGLQSDENMLMCTLNVVFALACQLADFIRPEEREASADAFFSRAKDLLHFNLWNTGSAALIQCLLLMSQYLQSTDSAHQCWIITGLAIRNAQSLGLHLPQTIARLPSFQDQQLARKIWHGCVLMDRYVRVCFGGHMSNGSLQGHFHDIRPSGDDLQSVLWTSSIARNSR